MCAKSIRQPTHSVTGKRPVPDREPLSAVASLIRAPYRGDARTIGVSGWCGPFDSGGTERRLGKPWDNGRFLCSPVAGLALLRRELDRGLPVAGQASRQALSERGMPCPDKQGPTEKRFF